MDLTVLKKLGFTEKAARIYLTLISLGPSSVRNLAKKTEFNRGTVYDSLKWLRDVGVINYYEKGDIRKILEQVLQRCEETQDLEYRVYSDLSIRDYLYEGFESFSDARIAKGIKVKAIAIGGGGELRGLDERKWLDIKKDSPTYIIIYPGSSAYISLNAHDDLVGVVIENDGVYQTQKGIFDALWKTLK